MGVDLYAGTLTTFYLYTWNSAAGRVFGTRVKRLFAGGEPEYIHWPREKMRAAVEEWKEALNGHLRKNGDPIAKWEERDHAPDFAEQLGWEGLGTLRLVAMLDERRGAIVPTEPTDSPTSHPDWARWRSGVGDSRYLHLAIPQLWVPGSFDPVLQICNPMGGDDLIGCSGRLLHALRTLSQRHKARFASVPRTSFLDVADDMIGRALRLATLANEHQLPVVISH